MIVKSSALFFPPGHPLAATVRETAEIENPAWIEHERMVRSGVRSRLATKPPRYLQIWQEIPGGHAWAGGTMVPRCWTPPMSIRRAIESDTVEHFADVPALGYRLAPEFAPRDYQIDSAVACESAGEGVVVMPCGAGKTSAGVELIRRLGRRSLILVHTNDLAAQWVERIAGAQELRGQLVGAKVGSVGGGRAQTDAGADVVIATVQTLVGWSWRDLYAWGQGFGLVIMDEAHHAPADTFLQVLCGLPARYRIGLTATPNREDGMGALLWAAFGEVVFEVSRDELVKRGQIRPAQLFHHLTGCSVQTHEVREHPKAKWVPIFPQEVERWRAAEDFTGYPKVRPRPWHAQVRDLSQDDQRNGVVLDLAEAKVSEGHSVIVLSELVDHCRALAAALCSRGLAAEAVAGHQGSRAVSAILGRARRGETKVLVGTTKADEGLDVPILSCGILATRTKRFGRLTQRIGRIERPEGLRPEWYDLVDDFPGAIRAWKERQKLYQALNLEGATWTRRRRSA